MQAKKGSTKKIDIHYYYFYMSTTRIGHFIDGHMFNLHVHFTFIYMLPVNQ